MTDTDITLQDILESKNIDTVFDNNIKPEIFNVSVDDNKISADNYEYELKLRISNFSDVKNLKKFITSCERMIRMSPEYRLWVDYIHDVLGEHRCQITNEIHEQAKCDIHHHPYTLWDIVNGVISKKIMDEEEFCSADIFTEALELHYQMRVPFIVLVKSLHEKHHAGFLNLPISMCHGDLKYFKNTYLKYLDDDSIDTINTKLKITVDNCGWDSFTWTRDK